MRAQDEDPPPEAKRLPTGRVARTARVGGLVAGQGVRWAGMRAANRVRVYGSPATIAALDEIQNGFGMFNKAKGESERATAAKDIHVGLDHLVILRSG